MEIKIDMEANASKHLEFSVREVNGKFDVVEYFTNGDTLVYANFPNRTEAERFILAQPDCWEADDENYEGE